MSLIQQIQKKSWLMLVVIAVAMLSFIFGDLFSRNNFVSEDKQIVGEIAGKEVNLAEFNRLLAMAKDNYTRQTGGAAPNDMVMKSLQQNVWQKMLSDIAYEKVYKDLGLSVSNAELFDMVQGNNISPQISQSFKDSLGNVDRAAIQNYLQNLKNSPAGTANFIRFEDQLAQARKKEKLEKLVSKTEFINKGQAKKEYQKDKRSADVQYLYVRYSTVPDSLVKFTEADLKSYYNNNKDRYKEESNRSIEYVTFSLKPTAADKKIIRQEAQRLAEQFAKAANDTFFIEANTEGLDTFIKYSPKDLPGTIDQENIEIGKVYGPALLNDTYKSYKVVGITEDSLSFARASHILIKTGNETSDALAKQKASRILQQIRGGADFATMAREHSEDGSKSKGGDLGWFQDGEMVDSFNKAVMSAKKKGLIRKLIKSTYGYHIIKVTETKTNKKYIVGILETEVIPSDETINDAFRNASKYTRYKTADEFVKATDEDSAIVRYKAYTIRKDARDISNLTGSNVRQIVRWAYNDNTEVGSVSDIFELEDKYVIAMLKDKKEEGSAEFSAVQEKVKQDYLKEEKKKVVYNKLKDLSGSLEEIKEKYGRRANIDKEKNVKITKSTLSGVGLSPKAIGVALALEEGEVSKPIIDENAVVILKAEKVNKPEEIADYNTYKKNLASKNKSSMFKVGQAIEKEADVKDYRYKFF